MNKTAYEIGFEQGYNDMIKEAGPRIEAMKKAPRALYEGIKAVGSRAKSGVGKLRAKSPNPLTGGAMTRKEKWMSLTDAEKKTLKRLGIGVGALGTAGVAGGAYAASKD